MQIRIKQKTMNNKLKRLLWNLFRGHHKCRVQIMFMMVENHFKR